MIELETDDGRTVLVPEDPREIPSLDGTRTAYVDFETTSGEPREKAVHPYLGHRIAGAALVRDDELRAWYLPFRHRFGQNLSLDVLRAWLSDLMRVPRWVNHNVKFDAHFAAVEGEGGELEFPGELVDTLTLAKAHDTDRMGHGLKVLMREWLNVETSEQDAVQAFLDGEKTKDFGDLPVDLCARYAGMDVLGNRDLWRMLQERRPDQLADTWETEIKLTSVLFDMERVGMPVRRDELRVETVRALRRILAMQEELENLTGRPYVDSNKHLFDLVVNVLDLPVLKWNLNENAPGGRGSPCFDKEALELYAIHPSVTVNGRASRIIKLIKDARKESHFKSNYLDVMTVLGGGDGLLHPSYNQIVRTGRMSARDPNSTGMSPRAKDLVHPLDGEKIISADASQIEFRLIVHYINDADAVAAYACDPDTDFHAWVAVLCEVERDPGKTLNFAMGYGAGKRRVVSLLRTNPLIMAAVSAEVNALVEAGRISARRRTEVYERLCQRRASEIYYRYHERLPGIKRTTRIAAQRCVQRGYVFNPYGRRRHLPPRASHKAFNTVVQGGAMDIIKRRMLETSPRFQPWVREAGLRMFVNVHDELAWRGPAEACDDPLIQAHLHSTLETADREFRVPFTWDMGVAGTSWRDAGKDDACALDKEELRRIAADRGWR